MSRSKEESIVFHNRYSGQDEVEQVYGEAYLRWIYGNPLGRLTLEGVVKRAWFSRWFGWRMDRASSRKKIKPFIRNYQLDEDAFLKPADAFESFNDFFSRQLKADARPVDPDPASVVFPADGRHLALQDVGKADGFFVKGQTFDLKALLGDAGLAEKYARGTLILSRLCPVDYHRFHFPCAGVPDSPRQAPRLLSGPLYSVSPIALRDRLSILWENKRYLTVLHSDDFGDVLILEIGATCVGSVVHTHVPGQYTPKGGEKGYFRFGGSSVITLFEPGQIQLAEDLLENSAQGKELYAHIGDVMGQARQASVNITE